METRRIGSLSVSLVGLGCNNFGWRLDYDASARVIDAAMDEGIFFDTADIYGATKSEEFLGRALGSRRDRVLIASKFGLKVDENRKGARPEYVKQACADSLKRLGTDRIDLYQLHTPDATVPIADTLGALDELVKAGKVREIGCSNFSAAQLREAASAVKPGAARFVSVQNDYSLFKRDPETNGVLEECKQQGLAFLPYYPLASGLLTGKYRKGQPVPTGTRIATLERYSGLVSEKNLNIVEELIQFASSRGHTILELAFSWLASKPQVASVIAGATSPEQVNGNAAALNWNMTPEDLAKIDEIMAE
jgi:aryl-alcohol dehydrogenase-like predicted oxidoreductase